MVSELDKRDNIRGIDPGIKSPTMFGNRNKEEPPKIDPDTTTKMLAKMRDAQKPDPKKPATEPVRTGDRTPIKTGSYLNVALADPTSEAAKIYGLDKPLNDDEKEFFKNAQKKAADDKPSMLGGFFSSIMDFIVAIFKCLTGEGFDNFSKIKSERKAMRAAETMYKAIMDPNTPSPYTPEKRAEMAKKISGIEPVLDANGQPTNDFKPVVDTDGKNTGEYGYRVAVATNPGAMGHIEAADRGVTPSKQQAAKMEAIYQEESAKLYQRADIQKLVDDHAKDPKPAHGIAFSPEMDKEAERIADRMIAEANKDGRLDMNTPKSRSSIIGMIKTRMEKGHADRQKVASEAIAKPADSEQLGKALEKDGYKALQDAWQVRAYAALKPEPMAPAAAVELARQVTELYKDKDFIAKSPKDQQEAIVKMLDANPKFTDAQKEKLAPVIEGMAKSSKEALDKHTPAPDAPKPPTVGLGAAIGSVVFAVIPPKPAHSTGR